MLALRISPHRSLGARCRRRPQRLWPRALRPAWRTVQRRYLRHFRAFPQRALRSPSARAALSYPSPCRLSKQTRRFRSAAWKTLRLSPFLATEPLLRSERRPRGVLAQRPTQPLSPRPASPPESIKALRRLLRRAAHSRLVPLS